MQTINPGPGKKVLHLTVKAKSIEEGIKKVLAQYPGAVVLHAEFKTPPAKDQSPPANETGQLSLF